MKTVTPRKCIIIVIYSKMTQKYRTLWTTSTVAGRPTNSWLEKTKHRSIKQKASPSHRNAITRTHAKELKKNGIKMGTKVVHKKVWSWPFLDYFSLFEKKSSV